MPRGLLHEWFGGDERRHLSTPPLTILLHLARRAVRLAPERTPGAVVWIGRACRPYPPLMERGEGPSLLRRSVFVDAGSHEERVWALDLALRCPCVDAVIGDASGMSMAESRRLQLAASAGGALALLVRPAREVGEISAAQTRWLVRSEPSECGEPRWRVELLRCKGMRPVSEDARRVAVQWRHETGDVRVVPDALDRPAETERRPIHVRRAV